MLSYNRRKNRTKTNVKHNNKGNRPVIYVFRSNKNIYAQLINIEGKVITSYSTLEFEKTDKVSGVEKAKIVGKEFAKLCKKQGIEQVVFNKGPYNYNGRIKLLADACREEGLKF